MWWWDLIQRKSVSRNHDIAVRSSYQLSFYNVFIVCYLLIESLKKKRSPFLPFLRFPLYVVFGRRDISSSRLYRLVWQCMSPEPCFQCFCPFKTNNLVFFNSHNLQGEKKPHPSCSSLLFAALFGLSCTKIANCLKQLFFTFCYEKTAKKKEKRDVN